VSDGRNTAGGCCMTKLTKPVHRLSLSTLDGTFGSDRNKRVVITLIPGNPDVFELRPERTRRPEQIAVIDVYRFALRSRVNREVLERARQRKERKAERLAALRIARAEKRLTRPL